MTSSWPSSNRRGRKGRDRHERISAAHESAHPQRVPPAVARFELPAPGHRPAHRPHPDHRLRHFPGYPQHSYGGRPRGRVAQGAGCREFRQRVGLFFADLRDEFPRSGSHAPEPRRARHHRRAAGLYVETGHGRSDPARRPGRRRSGDGHVDPGLHRKRRVLVAAAAARRGQRGAHRPGIAHVV